MKSTAPTQKPQPTDATAAVGCLRLKSARTDDRRQSRRSVSHGDNAWLLPHSDALTGIEWCGDWSHPQTTGWQNGTTPYGNRRLVPAPLDVWLF